MSLTDQEMKNITQVAYADLAEAYDYMRAKNPDRSSFTIDELTAVEKQLNPQADLGSLKNLTKDQRATWKIAGVHDANSKNGFYACIVETAPDEAVMGFRGSEGGDLHDWVGADLGLLNAVCTEQQLEADRFLEKYADQLSTYDGLSATGHSLGGNLAEYATLMAHHHGVDNIDSCISFDGPGFSNEFINLHMADIERMNGVMRHYRWSLVGNLLFELPGVTYVTCEVKPEADGLPLHRHDTKYLVFDEETGSVIEGKTDPLAAFASWLSKSIDGKVRTPIFNSAMLVYILFTEFKDDAKKRLGEIMDAVKTTYSDVKAKLKKLFSRGNEYFLVNTARLSKDAYTIDARLRSVQRYVDDMFTSVEQLSGMWKGSANRAFIAKFAAERTAIDEYLGEVAKYIQSIISDSAAYERCEAQAVGIIDAIRV